MDRFLVVKCLPLVLFLLLGIIPSHKANSADVCDPPFFKLGSQCFFFSIREKKTWFEARQACKSLGGDLAKPKSIRRFQAIKKMVVGDTRIWLGICDSDSKGTSENIINTTRYQGGLHCFMAMADNGLSNNEPLNELGFACGYELLK